METLTNYPTLSLLIKFANQRPQLEYANYGDPKSYRAESREITKDLHDFREFLNFAIRRLTLDKLEQELKSNLENSNDRLTLEGNKLQYITGQYFPTEYRPACTRILRRLIWDDYAQEKHENGSNVYETSDTIRKRFKMNLSRRAYKNYIN
jgi:hypothetical protein